MQKGLVERLAEILSKIPRNVWDEIVKKELEWIFMEDLFSELGFGKYAVLLVALALNDYQTKGKSEVGYWPRVKSHLEKFTLTINQPEEMIPVLEKFFKNERLNNRKILRLKKFLQSELAREIWNSSPEWIASHLMEIWDKLARTMSRDKNDKNKNKKTIAVAIKCLGILLLIEGFRDFEYNVPIPVDSRVKDFTKRIVGNEKDIDKIDKIIKFWQEVLNLIKESVAINMIHLDSLIWQVASFLKEKSAKEKFVDYFRCIGVEDVGNELAELIFRSALNDN